MHDFRPQTCCFTGHRDIPDDEVQKIRIRMFYRFQELVERGYLYFGVGGALGFDTMAAEFLLEYRRSHRQIKIIEVLPFKEYRNRWTPEQQHDAEMRDRLMDKIVYCCNEPSKEAYLVRDRHLVDCSSACISYCNRATGGTAYTVRYALQQGIPVLNSSSFDVHRLLENHHSF